jgi:hypothetical protein
MEKDQLRKILQTNRCEVTFTKVDGSVRTMPCTLLESELPARVERAEKEGVKAKKENPDTISVWCLDKKEWRSFRVANVQKVDVLG